MRWQGIRRGGRPFSAKHTIEKQSRLLISSKNETLSEFGNAHNAPCTIHRSAVLHRFSFNWLDSLLGEHTEGICKYLLHQRPLHTDKAHEDTDKSACV